MSLSNRDRALRAVVEAVKRAGSEAKLAEEINRLRPPDADWTLQTRSHVASWKYRKRCPEQLVLIIERVTGVSRFELRPDVYYELPDTPQEPTREAAE